MTASHLLSLGGQLALWVTRDANLFERNGVNVDLRPVEGTAATGALLAGETQLALIGGSEALHLAAGGADVVVIGVLEPVYPYQFEVPKDVKTAADLKGKKVSFGSGTGSSGTATTLVLKQLGLDPDKDVVTVHFSGGVPARLAAMQSGAIDAALITPPDNLAVEAAGFHSLVDTAELGLHAANETMLMKRSWLETNRPTAQKFVNAAVQGIAELKRNRQAGIAALAKYQKIQGQQALDAAYDFFAKEEIPDVPEPRPEMFADILTIASAQNPQVKNVSLERLLDASLMQAAGSAK
ncbi:MAG TPA: ABC transporter substrate-binding protein [Chloroflexota bacterium]